MNSRATIHTRVVSLVTQIPSFSPFTIFVKEVLSTYEGVQELDRSLDVATTLENFLEHVLEKRVDEVDESVFARFFLGLPIHTKIICCKTSDNAWIPTEQTFSNFIETRQVEDLSLIKWKGNPQDLLDWMITLMTQSDQALPAHDETVNTRH